MPGLTKDSLSYNVAVLFQKASLGLGNVIAEQFCKIIKLINKNQEIKLQDNTNM